jgi:GNAT superfamily N-acetyltransferase
LTVGNHEQVSADRPERDRRIAFRQACGSDVAAVVALVESAYRGDSSRTGWTTEADLLDGQRTDAAEVLRTLEDPQSVIVLAELDGRIAGTCHLRRSGRTTRLGMFAVSPGLQGAGLGRALIERGFEIASGWGCEAIEMAVIRHREELIAWYRRLGFEPTGETEPFPYGDERFGIPRRDDLEFVILAAPVARKRP